MDKAWVKWLVIGSSLGLTLIIIGVFFLKLHLENLEQQRQQEAREQTYRKYESEFRSAMTRTYQNLKLRHYLAAYRLLDGLEPPLPGMELERREYHEALLRVGKALLEDQFYDEAERFFKELVNTEHNEEARENLSKIASEYRLTSARKYLATAQSLLNDERWQEAENETRKARLEFDSVKLFGHHDVSTEIARLNEIRRIAKHHVHLGSARREIEKAERFLEIQAFEELRSSMSRASQHVGRAAYFDQKNPEIDLLRGQLFELEAEFSYVYPNQIPIWNAYQYEERDTYSEFFFLHNYTFDLDQEDSLRIGLDYSLRLPPEDYYVVRYKVYFHNGLQFFNGHVLESSPDVQEVDKKKVIYKQELPERFQNADIKRVDLKIYTTDNLPVATLSRAFKEKAARAN